MRFNSSVAAFLVGCAWSVQAGPAVRARQIDGDADHETHRILNGPRRKFIGVNPESSYPLGHCEGDCDIDDHCGDGLVCYQRERNDPIPGCSGSNGSKTDYCVYPKDIDGGEPTPTEPAPTPTAPAPTPSNDEAFRLKLYWEQGYFWQEQTFEIEWCMECRNGGCSIGEKLYIDTCKDDNQFFNFVRADNDYLIQLDGTNTCLEREGLDIFVKECDAGATLQQWFARNGSFDDRRFMISQRRISDKCVTQRHHPKADEEVEIEPCATAAKGNTRYWNKF